jgi:hypothetical protein
MSLLSLAAAACATGAMVVASSCGGSGGGGFGDGGGATTATTAGATTATTAGTTTTTTTGFTTGTTTTTGFTTGTTTTTGFTTGTTSTTTTGTTATTTTTGTTATTTTGTTATTTTTGTTAGATTAATTCPVATPTAGALVLAANYLTASVFGMGGYAYAFSDATIAGPSTACVLPTAFCGHGSSGPANMMAEGTVAAYGFYGGGIGVNIDEAMGASAPVAYTPTGNGITYAVTSVPMGLRLIIGDGPTGTDYCAMLTAPSGTLPWSSFYSACYDTPPTGALTAAPSSTHVEFEVASNTTAAVSWDFCVTALSFSQ